MFKKTDPKPDPFDRFFTQVTGREAVPFEDEIVAEEKKPTALSRMSFKLPNLKLPSRKHVPVEG